MKVRLLASRFDLYNSDVVFIPAGHPGEVIDLTGKVGAELLVRVRFDDVVRKLNGSTHPISIGSVEMDVEAALLTATV